MRMAGYRFALLLAAVFASGIAVLTAGAASAQEEAITATVTGEAIQKVGFRAMIQKEAIMLNLAGAARNNPDGTVKVSLQGDKVPDRSGSRRYPRRQQEIFERQHHRPSPGHSGSQSEVVHGFRLDVDHPEHHQPLRPGFSPPIRQ